MTTEPIRQTAGIRPIAIAIAVPLVLVALAYALWWLSDRLGGIGPLDRAAFGWIVVIPLWIGAPVVAGFAWRPLPARSAPTIAVAVGSIVGLVAATFFWQAMSAPKDCAYGSVEPSGGWLLPSLLLGAVIGGGLAISALVTASAVRAGYPWRAVALGAGTEILMVAAAILVGAMLLSGPGCQRPVG